MCAAQASSHLGKVCCFDAVRYVVTQKWKNAGADALAQDETSEEQIDEEITFAEAHLPGSGSSRNMGSWTHYSTSALLLWSPEDKPGRGNRVMPREAGVL